MKVTIASRIFAPEPSAASFRLGALAEALALGGHRVTVRTVRPPKSLRGMERDSGARYRVKRFPVLRDRSGYVRGYLPYLSFDLPVFFRLTFSSKQDFYIVEPPPTTGFAVCLAAAIRRTPFVYYAADIWSDAAAQTGAPAWMIRAVRAIERFSINRAVAVLSVSREVTDRLDEIGVSGNILTIGNGVDTRGLTSGLRENPARAGKVFIYAGTASEWHGAEIFIQALPQVLAEEPEARIRFIGGGSEQEHLKRLAVALDVSDRVTFEPIMSAVDLAPIIQGSAAALASVKPGSGYDFAFPTKLYSATVCGAPLVYAGPGPARTFVQTEVDGLPLGVGVEYDADQLAGAMLTVLKEPRSQEHHATVSAWGATNLGIQNVAEKAVSMLDSLELLENSPSSNSGVDL